MELVLQQTQQKTAGNFVERGVDPVGPAAPDYLTRHYWWAYVHPLAVKFWDHLPIINLVLYGHYPRLRDEALDALGPDLAGRTLQVTCCYGDFTPRLAARVAQSGGSLDVIDVLPIQLQTLRDKLPARAPVRTAAMDATDMDLPDATYDLFFLLHELPHEERVKAVREALRVAKPGAQVLLVDFGKPANGIHSAFSGCPSSACWSHSPATSGTTSCKSSCPRRWREWLGRIAGPTLVACRPAGRRRQGRFSRTDAAERC